MAGAGFQVQKTLDGATRKCYQYPLIPVEGSLMQTPSMRQCNNMLPPRGAGGGKKKNFVSMNKEVRIVMN